MICDSGSTPGQHLCSFLTTWFFTSITSFPGTWSHLLHTNKAHLDGNSPCLSREMFLTSSNNFSSCKSNNDTLNFLATKLTVKFIELRYALETEFHSKIFAMVTEGGWKTMWKYEFKVKGKDFCWGSRPESRKKVWYLIESSTGRESYLEVRCDLFFGELSWKKFELY